MGASNKPLSRKWPIATEGILILGDKSWDLADGFPIHAAIIQPRSTPRIMAKMLFRVLPESGHMNASFGLARELKTRGHGVIYATVDDYKGIIEAQGFEFFHLEQELGWENKGRFAAQANRSPIDWIRTHKMKFSYLRKMRGELLQSNGFNVEIEALDPDLVFIDSSFVRYAVALHQLRVPFAVIESQVAPDTETNVPPPTSCHVPQDSWVSRTICKLSWLIYFSERGLLQILGIHPMESKSFMKRLCRSTGYDFKAINFKRCFRIGLRSIPELIISTPEVDFPRTLRKNQVYIRTAVSTYRPEISYDYHFDRLFAQTLAWKEEDASHKLVYCSFGGMSFRYVGVEDFFRRLIQACNALEMVTLLISVGNELNIGSFEPIPDRVYLFRRVPQLKVLQATDLMVSHGGTNSISECMVAGVPMLAYPGAMDQPGNAARIVYHGMGLMGRLTGESSEQINRKISALLNDNNFAINARKKREEIFRNSAPHKVNQSIDAMLNLVTRMTHAKL